jgi:hypothetical protein
MDMSRRQARERKISLKKKLPLKAAIKEVSFFEER